MGARERDDRKDQAEASTLASDLVPELGTALADLEVVLDGAVVQGPAAQRRQLLPDLGTARVSCLGAMSKRCPRLVDERLHLAGSTSDRLSDFRLAERSQLEKEEGHPLILRQAAQIAQQLA
jgi:hypothetical protein